MKLLDDRWVRVTTGDHEGKIFQLHHYHKKLDAAYFPGDDGALLSLDELKPINPPFPYWRSRGEGQVYRYSEYDFDRCDLLPIGEQISKSAGRVLKLKTHIKLYKTEFKKSNKSRARYDVFSDRHYKYLNKELQEEYRLQQFLRQVVPYVQPQPEKLAELEEKYIGENPHLTGGNIASPPREEILETTIYQEKQIFPPTDLPKKKGGRPRGRKNSKPASGWVDIRRNKDGSTTAYYCREKFLWATKKDKIPSSKLPALEKAIEENYAIAQIEKDILEL